MTIADGLKYIEFLKNRIKTLQDKIRQFDGLRVTQRIVSASTVSSVVEQTEYTMNPKSLMSEYDETSKELRLVQQAIEKLNHTTELGLTPKY